MSSDRRAALMLVALGVAGGVARLLSHPGEAPGSIAYHAPPSSRSSLDSVAARASRLARPLRRGEKIDLDVVPRDEIARLPRVGLGLAARIAEDREKNGPFGSLEALDGVTGVGPSLLGAIAPYVVFSGPQRPSTSRPAGQPSAQPSAQLVSLNTASVHELGQLPGIGLAKARAIIEDRDRNGPYRSVGELTRVKGIGPAIVKRLEGRVQVP